MLETSLTMNGDGSPQNQTPPKLVTSSHKFYYTPDETPKYESASTIDGSNRGNSNSKGSRKKKTDNISSTPDGEANVQTPDTSVPEAPGNDTEKNITDGTSVQGQEEEQPANSSDEAKTRIIVIGNPGVGKSTILNTLVGKAEFESGLSLGSGCTKETKSYRQGEYEYVDTPGLEDVETRETAAKEISLAFRGPAHVVLIFVVILDAGRTRVDDLSCMDVVLSALETSGLDVANKHSIIINKCGPEVHRQLAEEGREVMASFKFVRPVYHVSALKLDRMKEEEDNAMLVEKENLSHFVRSAPTLDIGATANVCVDVAAYEAKKKAMEEEINKLREALAGHQGVPPAASGEFNTPTADSAGENTPTADSAGENTPKASLDELVEGESSGDESRPSSNGSRSEALRKPVLNMGLKIAELVANAAQVPAEKIRKL